MRKLTLKRKKQFVAMAVKVRICVRTEEEPDIKLVDANLKIVGYLKRAESIEFEIPNDATEVYLVFDKLLPQKFHAKYLVDAGEEDVTLYTQARFNPFKGNPFVITDGEVITKEDKQRMRKDEIYKKTSPVTKVLYWVIIIVSVIVGWYVGGMLAG